MLKFKSKYELSRQFDFQSLIPTLENNFSIQALQTMVLDKSITMPFASALATSPQVPLFTSNPKNAKLLGCVARKLRRYKSGHCSQNGFG